MYWYDIIDICHHYSWCLQCPLSTNSTSMRVCKHVWKIMEAKHLANEVQGHEVCMSSIVFAIAKLISKWVTPICIHSGHAWEYLFLHILSKNQHYIMGGKMVSHFNLHIYDLLMWLSSFYVSVGCLIFICCTASIGILCPFFFQWTIWLHIIDLQKFIPYSK